MTHPIQPLIEDENGVTRFKSNKIVSFLAEGRLNELTVKGFSNEDWEQLAQLTGYSLSGFGSLSYVSNEVYESANRMHVDGISEVEARANYLREMVDTLRVGLRSPIAALYEIHPDNLMGEEV